MGEDNTDIYTILFSKYLLFDLKNTINKINYSHIGLFINDLQIILTLKANVTIDRPPLNSGGAF